MTEGEQGSENKPWEQLSKNELENLLELYSGLREKIIKVLNTTTEIPKDIHGVRPEKTVDEPGLDLFPDLVYAIRKYGFTDKDKLFDSGNKESQYDQYLKLCGIRESLIEKGYSDAQIGLRAEIQEN